MAASQKIIGCVTNITQPKCAFVLGYNQAGLFADTERTALEDRGQGAAEYSHGNPHARAPDDSVRCSKLAVRNVPSGPNSWRESWSIHSTCSGTRILKVDVLSTTTSRRPSCGATGASPCCLCWQDSPWQWASPVAAARKR